jgi:hypothetical protein
MCEGLVRGVTDTIAKVHVPAAAVVALGLRRSLCMHIRARHDAKLFCAAARARREREVREVAPILCIWCRERGGRR